MPARYAKNRRLGIWVSAQRQHYKTLKTKHNATEDSAKTKRSSPLTQERIELLNALDFVWTIRSREPADNRSDQTNEQRLTTDSNEAPSLAVQEDSLVEGERGAEGQEIAVEDIVQTEPI